MSRLEYASLKHGAHYWVLAPTVDEDDPLMIAKFSRQVRGPDNWLLCGDSIFKSVPAGPGITVIAQVKLPPRKLLEPKLA